MLSAAALAVVGYDALFAATAAGFAASALLVVSAVLPAARTTPADRHPGHGLRATVRGLRVYLATPRLRGLSAVHLAVAAAGPMVLVDTVTYVRGDLGLGATAVAVALAANGLGSLVTALAVPRLLDRARDRAVMLRAGVVLAGALLLGVPATMLPDTARWPVLLALWAVIGSGSALVLTPSGRLLRREHARASSRRCSPPTSRCPTRAGCSATRSPAGSPRRQARPARSRRSARSRSARPCSRRGCGPRATRDRGRSVPRRR